MHSSTYKHITYKRFIQIVCDNYVIYGTLGHYSFNGLLNRIYAGVQPPPEQTKKQARIAPRSRCARQKVGKTSNFLKFRDSKESDSDLVHFNHVLDSTNLYLHHF